METQPAQQHGFTGPIGGLIVVLFTALFVGGWLYVDMIRYEIELKVAAVDRRAAALERRLEGSSGPNDGWRTFVSVNDEYQVDLPPGTRLSEGEGSAYVVADEPLDEMILPIAIIQIAPVSDRSAYEGQGGRVVVGGGKVYWLYPWQNEPWEPFERMADSFRVL